MSRVVIPCVKGPCCRPSTSTQFVTDHPAELRGIISDEEFQSSIKRINQSLQRPKWTFRVQTIGRILMLVGIFMLLVAGGKYAHMKLKHHQEKHDADQQQPPQVAGPRDATELVNPDAAAVSNFAEVNAPVPSASFAIQTRIGIAVSPSFPFPANMNENNPEAVEEEGKSWGKRRHEDEEEEDDDDDDGNKRMRRHHRRHHRRDHEDEQDAVPTAPATAPAPAPATTSFLAPEYNLNNNDHHHNDGGHNKEWRHKKCHGIKHLARCGLLVFLIGFGLCRWMVSRKKHQLITAVVPAVCAEHYYYTAANRSVPIAWSLDEKSIVRYYCKNNQLQLVLDLHSLVPLKANELHQQQLQGKVSPETQEMMTSTSSAYVPLQTNEPA